jgi:hypothetical protein
VLRRLPYTSTSATWNDKRDQLSYTLDEAPTPHPRTTPLMKNQYIEIVHEAGDASVVWSIGNSVLCKAKCIEEGATPEPVTLQFVQGQQPSFSTPAVLSYTVHNGTSFLFLQRLPGRTLDAAWSCLSKEQQLFYVRAIVDICKEMAQWTSPVFGGVDGQYIPEDHLLPHPRRDYGALDTPCREMGMDCSDLVFYHADLGPGNIIIENSPSSEGRLGGGSIGIIDFEIAGYLPRGWVRTKFRLSSGMNLSAGDEPGRWRSEVQKTLGQEGFEDYSAQHTAWRKRQYASAVLCRVLVSVGSNLNNILHLGTLNDPFRP